MSVAGLPAAQMKKLPPERLAATICVLKVAAASTTLRWYHKAGCKRMPRRSPERAGRTRCSGVRAVKISLSLLGVAWERGQISVDVIERGNAHGSLPRARWRRRSSASLAVMRSLTLHSQRNTRDEIAMQITNTAARAATSPECEDQLSPTQIPCINDVA